MLVLNKLPGTRIFFSTKNSYLEKRTVSGLQFLNRNDASISKPFVKYYDKFRELQDNSTEFYNYLISKGINIPLDLKRLEVTLKNSRHHKSLLKSLNFSFDLNIFEVLSLSQNRIKDIIHALHSKYYPLDNQLVTNDNSDYSTLQVSPSDWLLCVSFIELAKETNITFEGFIKLLKQKPDISPNSVSRHNRRLKDSLPIVVRYYGIRGLKEFRKDVSF